MEYACPVCEVPQSDGEHLANHLAFTAMLHGDEHEAWLDEHVPEWGDLNPDGLAEQVVEFAGEAAADEALHDHSHDHENLFEEESGQDGHDHTTGRPDDFDVNAARQRGGADLDEEAQQILAEAQELTEEMYASDEESEASGADDGDDGAGDDGADTEGKDQ